MTGEDYAFLMGMISGVGLFGVMVLTIMVWRS